ncbi:hypothetical protein CMUS01_13293 [Colletotrichum musicola]|uniref:Uncharacterized protein n=1 Tax=Colletotrichum musicola TaxID=2175873 RepID=A0A8H6JEV0_9PEZI|nr:hypothetical protein CMUS01_13293 [Colletotrichum musicola]
MYNTSILRPAFECAILSREEIVLEEVTRQGEVTWDTGGVLVNFTTATITLDGTLPPNCSLKSHKEGFGGPELTLRYNDALRDGELDPKNLNFLIGQYIDLDIQASQPAQLCPTIGIIFGERKQDEGRPPSPEIYKLTGFFCSQGMEEIPATTTYRDDAGDNNIGDIELYPDAAKPWWNETDGGKILAFKLDQFLDYDLTELPTPTMVQDQDQLNVDMFFKHLMSGSSDDSPARFLGPENAERLKIAVVRNYREYIAHVIDLNFRSPNTTVIHGVASQPVTRIFIHPISKLVLQGLLATMTILGLVGYKLVKLRGTLPRDPCSIASTMGFLADSQLCDPGSKILPNDAAAMSNKELAQSLHGYVFSLGWWDGAEGRCNTTGASNEGGMYGEREPELDLKRTSRFGIDIGQADTLGFYGKNKSHEARRPW